MTTVTEGQLRSAVQVLLDAGIRMPVLTAAAKASSWHPTVTTRVQATLSQFVDELQAYGVDVQSLVTPAPASPSIAVPEAVRRFGASPASQPTDPALRQPVEPVFVGRLAFGAGPSVQPLDPALRTPVGTPNAQLKPAGQHRVSQVATAAASERPRHEVELPTVPVLSAAAVLNLPSHKPPLEFEGTLDGLRGVPIDDLAGIRDDAGVGDKELERLHAAGISSVYDLMMRIPLRYIDRSQITALADLRPGTKNVATVGKWSPRKPTTQSGTPASKSVSDGIGSVPFSSKLRGWRSDSAQTTWCSCTGMWPSGTDLCRYPAR